MKFSYLYFLFLSSFYTSFSQSYVPEKNNSKIKINPAVPIRAYAFNLRDVKLLNSPFTNAMSKDSAYLMLLKPNRLLYRFYKHSGLAVKGSIYGGWESEGLSGHTLGHYLSAVSMMYISTGNQSFKNKIEYVVNELGRCQKDRKTVYIGAIPFGVSILSKIFFENEGQEIHLAMIDLFYQM